MSSIKKNLKDSKFLPWEYAIFYENFPLYLQIKNDDKKAEAEISNINLFFPESKVYLVKSKQKKSFVKFA